MFQQRGQPVDRFGARPIPSDPNFGMIHQDNTNYLKELIENYEFEIIEMRRRHDQLLQDKLNLENSYYYLLNDNNALINELERLQKRSLQAVEDEGHQPKQSKQKEDSFFVSVK